MSGSSPIFVKTYDLLVWLEQALAKFPKEQRFRLAARIEESLLHFYDLILHAARARDRYALLQEADIELEKLRTLLRAEYLVDAQGLNKIQGQPFKVAEVVNGVNVLLDAGTDSARDAG